MPDHIAKFLDRLFNQYKFVRRFTLFWQLGTVTAILAFCVLYSELVTDPVARVFIAIIGLTGVITAMYMYMRDKDQ